MTNSTVGTPVPARRGAPRCCAICGAAYRSEFQRCPNDGGELSLHETDPLIGKVLGDRYEIEALIGEGAMGRVYRARHTLLKAKRFAIKVMLGDLAVEAEMRMRFAREADATSMLEHPAIVAVHDSGRTRTGLLFLVLDLVEGETLGHVVRRGPMSPARVIRLARQLCQGLAHAHARGVIHRDLKPDNILLTSVGEAGEQARISDFGLAVTSEDDARLTRSGVVCTPAYAAPEQLLGKDIDHRADLYALGATLFEMLSGGVPVFEGDALEVTARKLANQARSIAVAAPYTPLHLMRLVARLLDPDPTKRPPTALAVLARLDNPGTDPTVPTEVTGRRLRRSRLEAACAAVATLAVISGGVPSPLALGAVWSPPVESPDNPPATDEHVATSMRGSTHEQAPAVARTPVAARMPVAASRSTVSAPAAEPPPPTILDDRLTHRDAPVLPIIAPTRSERPHSHVLRVVSLVVEGSLPRSVVERAVDRAMPAVQSCRVADAVVARFTIGDSRRAIGVHSESPCVAQALAHLRTEIAPDMGDARVVLKLR